MIIIRNIEDHENIISQFHTQNRYNNRFRQFWISKI